MALRKLGSVKATDSVLLTSVNLASEVTGLLPLSNIGNVSGPSKILGRFSAGAGIVEELTVSTGLALDGSGNLTATGASPLTTKGDIFTFSTVNARLPIGSNNTVLMADSAQTTGNKWAQIADVSVATGAAIARSKLAAGTASHVIINDGSGNFSSEAQLAVSRGGTGLGSGTSGGVLYFSASGVLASSGALTANALVIGGGTGVAPSTPVGLGTTAQVLHGNAGGAPSFGAVVIADLASAITSLFAQVNWGAAGAEASNIIEVPATVQDLAGATLAVATTEVQVMVSDSSTDAEPSATAVLQAAGTPVGTLLAGSGTATAWWRTTAGGLFTVAVLEAAVGSRYLWVKTGKNSQAWVRANASPKQITFA